MAIKTQRIVLQYKTKKRAHLVPHLKLKPPATAHPCLQQSMLACWKSVGRHHTIALPSGSTVCNLMSALRNQCRAMLPVPWRQHALHWAMYATLAGRHMLQGASAILMAQESCRRSWRPGIRQQAAYAVLCGWWCTPVPKS